MLTEKPWRWSDTWPVGKLVHAKSETQLYVLEGAQGNALAFGPGHHTDSPPLGQGGSVIGGHRDTHFTFLKKVRARDIMQLQLPNSRWVTYRVVSKTIVDADSAMKVDVNGQRGSRNTKRHIFKGGFALGVHGSNRRAV